MAYERRLSTSQTTVTIPIGGGAVATSVAKPADFTKLELVLNVRAVSTDPDVSDIYAPRYGINDTLDAVGITLSSASGTTLTSELTTLGY